MDSWGRPTSTVCMDTFWEDRLPRVLPPTLSLRLAKYWTGTPASLQMPENTALLIPSVVYFWLAENFTTMPLFIQVQFSPSVFSGWLGWTAWALSQETIKLPATARQ